MKTVNVMDYERLARDVLHPSVFDYLAGGAGDELTMARNRSAFDGLQLRPRVLVDVSRIETGIDLFGDPLRLPLLLAPVALNRLVHEAGEAAAARATAACGAGMVVSTFASCSLEEIAAAANGVLWFQLYVLRDREVTRELIARAHAAGYRALVVTVDTPHIGWRERDLRNRFVLPPNIALGNFRTSTAGADRATELAQLHRLPDPSLRWSDIAWVKSLCSIPLLLKGVLTAEDAHQAAGEGVDGLIVSNHGGRQLDGVMATIEALPGVVDAVDGRLPILLDGAVRRGTDIVKALALGARAVLIGRPYLWALAVDGEAGTRGVLELLEAELRLALTLCGCPRVDAVGTALVRHPPNGDGRA